MPRGCRRGPPTRCVAAGTSAAAARTPARPPTDIPPKPEPWGWPQRAITGWCPCRAPTCGTCHGHTHDRRIAEPDGGEAARAGIAAISGVNWVTSLRLPPVRDTDNGIPCPSTNTWYFDPVRPRSTGLEPVLGSPNHRPQMRPVHRGPRPAQGASGLQLRQQGFAQSLPEPRPGSSPAAASRSSRPDPVPPAGTPFGCRYTAHAGSRTGLSLVQMPSDRVIGAPGYHRQQRLDPRLQLVGHHPRELLTPFRTP
jgi:hypothetical protein